jgi:drug/metabolite transporter (DMT)-like permease
MGFVYAILAAITWGFVYAIDQKILDKVSATSLLLIHSFFTIIILLPIWYFRSNITRATFVLDKSNMGLMALSLIFTLIANLFIYIAIQHLGSSKAAIFEIAYPFFVVIFSIFLFQTQVNLWFVLGALLLFAGSAIIVTLG